MDELDRVFGEGGALANTIPGYRVRAEQMDMARAHGSGKGIPRIMLILSAGV